MQGEPAENAAPHGDAPFRPAHRGSEEQLLRLRVGEEDQIELLAAHPRAELPPLPRKARRNLLDGMHGHGGIRGEERSAVCMEQEMHLRAAFYRRTDERGGEQHVAQVIEPDDEGALALLRWIIAGHWIGQERCGGAARPFFRASAAISCASAGCRERGAQSSAPRAPG